MDQAVKEIGQKSSFPDSKANKQTNKQTNETLQIRTISDNPKLSGSIN